MEGFNWARWVLVNEWPPVEPALSGDDCNAVSAALDPADVSSGGSRARARSVGSAGGYLSPDVSFVSGADNFCPEDAAFSASFREFVSRADDACVEDEVCGLLSRKTVFRVVQLLHESGLRTVGACSHEVLVRDSVA